MKVKTWIFKAFMVIISIMMIKETGKIKIKEKSKIISKFIKPEIVAVLASAFILMYVLMPEPLVGVADNGDFARIMSSVCLAHMTDNYNDNYFGYVSRQFRIVPSIPLPGGYFTTEIPLVAAAVVLCKSVSQGGIFDIRFLSVMYSIVFLIAMYLIVRFGRRKAGAAAGWLLAAIAVLIFTDMGYISYFNTLYGEAVSLVFLLLAMGAAMWIASADKPNIYMLLLFFAGMVIFAGAKVQNSPLGVLGAVYMLGVLRLRADKRLTSIAVGSAVFLIAVSAFSYFTVSPEIKVCNKYQTVFYGILKDSPDPAQDLKELGLNRELAVLAGTNYFMESYPLDIRSESFKQDIFKSVSHFKIAGFYLKHPDRFIKKLEISANSGFRLKQGFGNYEKAPGIQYKQVAKSFSLWSNFKEGVLPHSLTFIIMVFTMFFMVIAFGLFKADDIHSQLRWSFLSFIGVVGVIQFMLPVIGDGEADLSKHLFLFNVSFDMMFAILAVCLFASIIRFAKSIIATAIVQHDK